MIKVVRNLNQRQVISCKSKRTKTHRLRTRLSLISCINGHAGQNNRQYETAFRALKSSVFNIEATHLTDIDRIEKLFSLVAIAFTWSYLVGIFLNEHMKPIRVLKNDRRAKSFFKYGLEYIAMMLLNTEFQSYIDIFKFLSCTYIKPL